MSLTAWLARIDWPATALLVLILLGVCAFVAGVRLRRFKAPPPPPAAPAQPGLDLGTRQFMQAMEQEMEQMRAELAALREEVAQLKARRDIAPQYGEAMTLASRGVDAQRIAQQCGISIAEAELVQALSRRISGEGMQDD